MKQQHSKWQPQKLFQSCLWFVFFTLLNICTFDDVWRVPSGAGVPSSVSPSWECWKLHFVFTPQTFDKSPFEDPAEPYSRTPVQPFFCFSLSFSASNKSLPPPSFELFGRPGDLRTDSKIQIWNPELPSAQQNHIPPQCSHHLVCRLQIVIYGSFRRNLSQNEKSFAFAHTSYYRGFQSIWRAKLQFQWVLASPS